MANTLLSYEELNTFSIEVEAILNSRPLTPMSQDPNDLQALTPGHLLIGTALNELPQDNFQSTPSNCLTCWDQITKMKQSFWKRWHNEYLNNLIQRPPQPRKQVKIAEGMLVLIQDDATPSMNWPLGRVTKLYPGSDDVVRTVAIQTQQGTLTRPVTKIAVLPIEDNQAGDVSTI